VINTNAINTPKTTGADLTQLVEQLAKRADANRDGQVSTSEFAQFLVGLLQQTSTSSLSTPSATSTIATPTKSTSIEGTPLPPCPGGWDPVKWTNPNHNTPKYVVGRILWRFPPTPDGLTQAMPEIQKAMPGTTRVGDDKLNIPDVGIVDVGVAFGIGGGVGWGWGI
jgi:hypothetical protein